MNLWHTNLYVVSIAHVIFRNSCVVYVHQQNKLYHLWSVTMFPVKVSTSKHLVHVILNWIVWKKLGTYSLPLHGFFSKTYKYKYLLCVKRVQWMQGYSYTSIAWYCESIVKIISLCLKDINVSPSPQPYPIKKERY